MIMSIKDDSDDEPLDLDLVRRFNGRFGRQAEIIAVRHLHGHHDSPLAGNFAASAHTHLLQALMHRTLGDDDDLYRRNFDAFIADLEEQHEESPKDTPSVNDGFIGMVEETIDHAAEVIQTECSIDEPQ